MSRAADQRGFTLVEMAVAIGVFGVLLVGMSLIFRSAFATVNQARFDQTAKTLAQERLEEIRSLPFYVANNEDPADVDVLDRYFVDSDDVDDQDPPPGATGTYDPTADVWTYTTTDVIDPADAPAFTRVVDVQFVVPSGGVLSPQPPIEGYDSDVAGLDEPGTDAVRVTVTVSWTTQGRPRSMSLDTVISRVERDEPKVDASGSVLGAHVSGVTFQDGDQGPAAAVFALVGEAGIGFREVTRPSAEASADPVEVVESDPETNLSLQTAPTGDESTASAPNSVSGNSQADPAESLIAESLISMNEPRVPIASWGSASPAALTEARVSGIHSQNPESRSQVTAPNVVVNARDAGESNSHAVLQLGSVSGVVEQRSTTNEVTVDSSVGLSPSGEVPAVTVWAARQFLSNPNFRGVVTVESMQVQVGAAASSTTSWTGADWQVINLRVWDPDLQHADGTLGDYTAPQSFGFSDCGGWVGSPEQCGVARTDGKEAFENPNPIVIPSAYVGTDAQGDQASSLGIVVGVTTHDSSADASLGTSQAAVGQRQVISITTRQGLSDAVNLEPMLAALGSATATASYVSHEH